MTTYQILFQNSEAGFWNERGTEEASSSEAAVRASYMKDSEGVIAMVAVPLRSWQPTAIRTKTVEKVVLGDEAVPEPVQEELSA